MTDKCDYVYLASVRDADKRIYVIDGKKKVHMKFQDGTEMIEVYNMETGVVVTRATLARRSCIVPPVWELEVGDKSPSLAADFERIGIVESRGSPYVTKRLTKTTIEWRIRNLPFPIETYVVDACPHECCLVLTTKNKKYYRKIKVDDLDRIGLQPAQEDVSVSHQHNTLLISYSKPAGLLLVEELVFAEINKAPVSKSDTDCRPS